jgi:hypothetical protein
MKHRLANVRESSSRESGRLVDAGETGDTRSRHIHANTFDSVEAGRSNCLGKPVAIARAASLVFNALADEPTLQAGVWGRHSIRILVSLILLAFLGVKKLKARQVRPPPRGQVTTA